MDRRDLTGRGKELNYPGKDRMVKPGPGRVGPGFTEEDEGKRWLAITCTQSDH